MSKASILSVCIALVSIAVLLGVYQHSENVRHANQLALRDQNAQIEETHRRLEQQMKLYKEKLANEMQHQHEWANRQIQEQTDAVIAKVKDNVERRTSELKVELLADNGVDTVPAPRRRELKINDASNDFTAILLQSDNSGIKFGVNGDSNIYRKKLNTLQTDGNFVVGGALKLGDGGQVSLKTTDNQLSVMGDLMVQGTLSADTLKTNHSHLSYMFPVGEAISKGDVVSLLGGKLRKGFGVGVGATDVISSSATNVRAFYVAKDTFFVMYKAGDGGYGVVGSVDAQGKLTVGAAQQFQSGVQGDEYTAAVVSATRVAVIYRNKGNNYCYAVVGTIAADNKLTFSGKKNQFSTTCNGPAASSLGNDKFAIIYKNTKGTGTGLVGKVADKDSINFGAAENFNSFAVDKLAVTFMADDLAVFTFLDSTKNSRPMAQIFKARGTEVSFDSKKQLENTQCGAASITSVSANKAVVAYREKTSGTKAKVIVVDIVKGYLETGNPITFTTMSASNPNFADISVAAVGGNRVLVVYRDHEGAGQLLDGDVVGKMVFLGKRQSFLKTKSSSAFAASTGTRWVLAFQDDSDGNKGKARVVTQWGGARALGVAIASSSGATGNIGVVLQGVVDAFSAGKFHSGGVYFAGNNGMVQANEGVGVSLGRALTDSLLLLENLAAQNDVDLAADASVSGGGSTLLLRYRSQSSFSSGHWMRWQKDWETKEAFLYEPSKNYRFTFKNEGIYQMGISFNMVGNANGNYILYYVNGQSQLRTWESCGGNWWQDLNLFDLVRAKKNDYIQFKAWWQSSGQGWTSFARSTFYLWRVHNSYDLE